MLPSEYLALGMEERAFVIASIRIKIKHEKDEQDRMKRKSSGKGRR
ncbi:MAG TPA: hypothetical protein VHQ24_13020 [Lachnospiraceae bacterium]|nr:hypothetical protein [Lachnospiraceae bacterium]